MTDLEELVKRRFALAETGIAAALESAGRNGDKVTVLGVTKGHSAASVVEGFRAGIKLFGENRVQEAESKIPEVQRQLRELGSDTTGLIWHMIGRLQSNKARRAAQLFDVVQSVDSIKLAEKLAAASGDLGKRLQIFVEVNTSGESSKGGVSPSEAVELAVMVGRLESLELRGLMTIGPLTEDTGRIESAFRMLDDLGRELNARRGLAATRTELSMGMSDDFKIAVRSGSTMVRLGSALFGARGV